MKKILLFSAVVSLSTLFVLSCTKNGGEQGGGDEPQKEAAKLDDPKNVKDAITITFAAPAAGQEEVSLITIDNCRVLPEKAIFTESGRYVFTGVIKQILTKAPAVGDTFTKTGEYTKDGQGNYKMPGVGTVTPSETPSQQGSSTQTDAELKSESGETVSLSSTVTTPPAASGTNEKNMVRSWVPEGNVHVEIPSKKISTNVAADLKAIAKYLKEHEVNINPDDYEGYGIADISMSLAEKSFIVAFTNTKAYVGSWQWTNQNAGQFSYNFSSNLGSELISGSASGSVEFYSENNVNKCAFVMSITVKGINGSLNFVLREKK